MPPGFELSPETAGPYFTSREIIPADASPTTRSLGGGVSNHVIEVRWDEGCLVAKQPLPNLAVEDDWPADVERVHNEAAAARAYGEVIDTTGLHARVPAVRFEDTTEHVIALECAPADAVMWKHELLEGRVDISIADALGDLLGVVHHRAADDEALRDRFGGKRPFEELRIDPYHRTTARRHPDVRAAILAEADRVMGIDRTLVHGDYSPKNVLVDRRVEDVPWILDFEVAHWGDPAFDPAFMCNHLFIKSIYNHGQHAEYAEAARAFWAAYDERVGWDVEAATVAELGVLMLARVDGKSPVEYVEEGPVARTLRRVAKRAIIDDITTIDGFAGLAQEGAASL